MKSLFGEDLTWICHICGEKRPDHLISVLTKPWTINGRYVGDQNIRYCNDKVKCHERAVTFYFGESTTPTPPTPPTPPAIRKETQQVIPDVSNLFRRLICKCVNFAKSITT